MSQNINTMVQVSTEPYPVGSRLSSSILASQGFIQANRLNGVSTVDFHITAKCSQACPYCWGPRRFRNPVDTEISKRIIARIKHLGVRRIVFTGGDPLQRPDAPDLIQFAKETGLETALSTTGDLLTPDRKSVV